MDNQEIAKESVRKIAEAIMPYVKIQSDMLLEAVLEKSIILPEGFAPSALTALEEVVWADIQKGNVGILPHWSRHKIIEITYKISTNGNPTWYCRCSDDLMLYVRQSNKEKMMSIYPDLEKMNIKEVISNVDIEVYTSTDGKFHDIEKVMPDGILNYAPQDAANKPIQVLSDYIQPISDDSIYFDIETNGLGKDAEIIALSIQTKGKAFETFVKPVDAHKLIVKDKKGISASDINGITPDMLEDADSFPQIYAVLHEWLHNKTVITYGDFDIKILNQVCERHDLPSIIIDHIDLMKIYAEYVGEVSARGGYKYHKLIDAYQTVVGKELDNPHNAASDVKAMIEIVGALKTIFQLHHA